MRDSGVHVGEGVGIYFGVFLSGESIPGMGRLERCQEIIC